MITINGVECKDNLDLKTIAKVNVTPKYMSSNSLSYDYNNVFVFQNKLCTYYYSDKFFYYYTGDNWVKYDDTASAPSGSNTSTNYFPIVYDNNIYMLGKTSSYANCYRISFNPYTWNLIGSIPFSTYGTSGNVYSYCVVGNIIYVLLSYSSTYHLAKLNINTLELTEVCDLTSYYTNQYRRIDRLVCYNDTLYLYDSISNTSNTVNIPYLYKLNGNNIQVICSFPFRVTSTGISPKVFIHKDKMYTYTSLSYTKLPYIWEYNDEDNTWIPKIRFPIQDNYYNYRIMYDIFDRGTIIGTNYFTDISSNYNILSYNDSIHAIYTSGHYIYNENYHDWDKAGYWICEIKDDTDQTTT